MRNLSKNTLKRFISAKANTQIKFLNTETRDEVCRMYFHYGRKIEKSKGYERIGVLSEVGKRFGRFMVLTINPSEVPKAARKLINFYQDYEKE